MQVKLFLSLLIWTEDCTISVGKPSARTSNFWTVRSLFWFFISESKQNFGFLHTQHTTIGWGLIWSTDIRRHLFCHIMNCNIGIPAFYLYVTWQQNVNKKFHNLSSTIDVWLFHSLLCSDWLLADQSCVRCNCKKGLTRAIPLNMCQNAVLLLLKYE